MQEVLLIIYYNTNINNNYTTKTIFVVVAVGEKGSIFILSTLSTTSLEEVAECAPDTIKWFQLYIYYYRYLCYITNFNLLL